MHYPVLLLCLKCWMFSNTVTKRGTITNTEVPCRETCQDRRDNYTCNTKLVFEDTCLTHHSRTPQPSPKRDQLYLNEHVYKRDPTGLPSDHQARFPGFLSGVGVHVWNSIQSVLFAVICWRPVPPTCCGCNLSVPRCSYCYLCSCSV